MTTKTFQVVGTQSKTPTTKSDVVSWQCVVEPYQLWVTPSGKSKTVSSVEISGYNAKVIFTDRSTSMAALMCAGDSGWQRKPTTSTKPVSRQPTLLGIKDEQATSFVRPIVSPHQEDDDDWIMGGQTMHGVGPQSYSPPDTVRSKK